MPKRKSQFTNELKQKYPFFRKGRNDFEAECITCGFGTFVLVANKGRLGLDNHVDSEKHKKAVRGEKSSAKVTDYYSKPGTQIEDNVQLLKPLWHFTQLSIINSTNLTIVLLL